MGIFLDTGFFLGLLHMKDENFQKAKRIYMEMSNGVYGLIYTSPYVISETVTLILVRTRNNDQILETFYEILYGEGKFVSILDWSRQIEQKTWELVKTHNKCVKEKRNLLSFVDASNIIFCRKYDILQIAAFDGDFEGYLTRIS